MATTLKSKRSPRAGAARKQAGKSRPLAATRGRKTTSERTPTNGLRGAQGKRRDAGSTTAGKRRSAAFTKEWTRPGGAWRSESGGSDASDPGREWDGETGYAGVKKQFRHKIASYQTLFKQLEGKARGPRPSPGILGNFAKLVDKGAVVHRRSTGQLKRWSKTSAFKSATECRNVLKAQFGPETIKAVTQDKSGGWLIAAAPTRNGKPFEFPR